MSRVRTYTYYKHRTAPSSNESVSDVINRVDRVRAEYLVQLEELRSEYWEKLHPDIELLLESYS